MRLISFFLFFFFSSFLSVHQVQAQAKVLLEYEVSQDMNLFDWRVFIEEGEIQEQIGLRDRRFYYFGAGRPVLRRLNFDKLHLVQIELELGLYKRGLKLGLSGEEIERAEEAIERHWESIVGIEGQIRYYAGVSEWPLDLEEDSSRPLFGKVEDYREGVWKLYEGDHEVLFSMVEKKYEGLYKDLEEDDEKYAELIRPSVGSYMKKIEDFSSLYHESLQSAYRGEISYDENDLYTNNVLNLDKIYLGSLEIYDCFKKNFKDEVWGEHQEALKSEILSWHTKQSMWGVDGYIEPYRRGFESNPWFITNELQNFKKAPLEVRERIAEFYRNNMLYNEGFINTDEKRKLGARVEALIGLKYLDLLTEEEQELFDRAVSAGVIELVDEEDNVFWGESSPLP